MRSLDTLGLIKAVSPLALKVQTQSRPLTLMYVDVPTNVSAIELISSPDTPKSQILICPLVLNNMLDGLISVWLCETDESIGSDVNYTYRDE